MKMRTSFTLVLLFLAAAPAWGGPDETPLRVGVHPFPPFIIEAPEGQFTGLCVDVWEEIAEDLGVDYEYVPYTERIGMVRALDYGEIDLAINPLHVSRIRLSMFEVSQPFFISSVGVATPSATRNQFQVFIQNLFSLSFLKVVLFLFVVMLFFGTLLWIVERRDNHYQFRPGFNGLLDGLWWAAVTMTTVGYGDKAPKTQAGKAIAVVWMFSAVIIVSGFTATIASTLTVNSLTSGLERLEELKVVERVGTVSATSSEDFLISNGILPTHAFETPRQALRSLAEGEVDAIVYDRTVMRYLINAERLDGLIQVLPATFNKQYRSFLMPRGSPLRQQIDPLLVSRINQADWQDVLRKYNLEEDV